MEKKRESVEAEADEQQHSRMEFSRRNFLIGSALGLGGVLLPQAGLAAGLLKCDSANGLIQAAEDTGAAEAEAPCVVYIFLRGGMDGLSMVAPSKTLDAANYNRYKAARPNIHLSQGLQLGTSKFMLHPKLVDLHSIYKQGKLAVMQGAGSPNNTRSHFDQMSFVESGTPTNTGVLAKHDGFLNRILANKGAKIQAASMQTVLPKNIMGAKPAVAVGGSLNRFVQMSSSGVVPGISLIDRVIGLFSGNVDSAFCAPAAASSEAIQRALSIVQNTGSWDGISPVEAYAPAGVSRAMAVPLRETVRLLKGSPGTRVVSIDVGGWDTHANMGVQDGYFAGRMEMVNHALATFQRDLESLGLANRVVTVVMSEFGRPLKQNGSLGLDHGRGGVMLVMGNKVRGGTFAKDWDLSRLNEGRDLRVTIDYRDVFGQVLQKHLRANVAQAFPGHTLNTSGLVIL